MKSQEQIMLELILVRMDTLLVKLDSMNAVQQHVSSYSKEALPILVGMMDKLKSKSRPDRLKITSIELPIWVDAELFEAHLQHCYRHHKSTNKDAQRGKLKQLEMARKKCLDPQLIQANAVGGSWLNFYAPDKEENQPIQRLHFLLDSLKEMAAKRG